MYASEKNGKSSLRETERQPSGEEAVHQPRILPVDDRCADERDHVIQRLAWNEGGCWGTPAWQQALIDSLTHGWRHRPPGPIKIHPYGAEMTGGEMGVGLM
jgi:hypothetical protein